MKRDAGSRSVVYSSEEIRAMIADIQANSSSIKDKKRTYRRVYPDFAEHYPTLFELACTDPSIDMQRLNFMLSMMEQVHAKGMTQHDASVEVGKNLYDGFVKPKLSSETDKPDI